MFEIFIDGRALMAEDGQSVLDVARAYGINIPTLCYHPALKPSGTCKLCAVEVTSTSSKTTIMLSCILKAKPAMTVTTRSEAVAKARILAFERLIRLAPAADGIRQLAEDHGVPIGPRPDGCIRCRLCIRVCKEIVGPAALKMEKRIEGQYVVPVEGRCIGCGTCANLCPTGAIRVADSDGVRTIAIRDEVIGRHPLARCEGCGKLFATPRFIEHVQQRTLSHHPDVKTHHRYCPTCAKLFSDRMVAVRAKIPGSDLPPGMDA
ncbi:MAG: 2Fe-2S iron-sulfur cluster-binding protein [Pseudomonadota bacterium]